MINPRAGFKPYPIKKNAVTKTTLQSRKYVNSLKHASGKIDS